MIYNNRQQTIAHKIETEAQLSKWKDWSWQLRHSIKTLEKFEELLGVKFEEDEREKLKETFEKFPLSITPYYLSLINKKDFKNDPVFKQSFGGVEELITLKSELEDPLSEDSDSPVEGITHRYPDRVLFHVSNICSMYCRHCTRKRKVGDIDYVPSKEQLQKGLDYIANTPHVRDVLLSGGDPFMLPDDKIDWLLSEITKIKHVEIVRIGTRMPVVLPYRITDKLVSILKKYQPLWINTLRLHQKKLWQNWPTADFRWATNRFF